MSKQSSNTAIEDVLSSIRKLVSEEPGLAGPRAAGGADRLVLTPALRIAEPVQDAAPTDAQSDDQIDLRALQDGRAPTLEEQIAKLEAAVGATAEDWEPDGSEVPRGLSSEVDFGGEMALDLTDEDEVFASAVRPVTPRRPAELHAELEAEAAQKASAANEAARPVAQVRVEPVNQSDETPEADIATPDESAEVDDTVVLSFVRHSAFTRPPEPVDDVDQDDSPTPEAAAEPAETVSSEIDGAALDGAEPTSAAPDSTEPAIDPDLSELDDGDDTELLDEDALREMITEIVREELQGVLGERITQNVRRMVRREVAKQLSLRDLS